VASVAWVTPTETVNAFIAAIEAKDVAAAVALTAATISYENVPIDPIVGQAGLTQTLKGFLRSADEVEWRILSQWAFGDTVVNERVDRFRIGNGWLELPVAGVFRVNAEGLIELWRDYFDMATYTKQLAELTK
jgi:limonene-1,2-epoxide hydrolase